MKILKIWMTLTTIALISSACAQTNAQQVQPIDDNVADPSSTIDDNGLPDYNDLIPGNAFISNSEIFIMESFPVQISLHITGELPNPCHSLEVSIHPANESNEIVIDVYSLYDPAITCIQSIEPFEENIHIPIGIMREGIYKVIVNGELVGEFSYPV